MVKCVKSQGEQPIKKRKKQKKQFKKFLKRESEGGTTFKMFLPHGRGDMTGSQTALEECRRAWDLSPKKPPSLTSESPQKKPIPEDRLFLFQTIPSTYFFRRIPNPSPAASTRRSHPAGSGTFVSTPGPTGGTIGGTFGSSGSIASPR